MQTNEANDEKDFVDDRAKQASLITDPDVVNRSDSESRIDRGASNQFADDRAELEKTEEKLEERNTTRLLPGVPGYSDRLEAQEGGR